MNDAQRPEASQHGAAGRKEEPGGDASQGPNLILLYSLIGLALAVAIALAALIVRPFYLRR
jgi:hypothetical protein